MDKGNVIDYVEELIGIFKDQSNLLDAIRPIMHNDHVAVEDKKKLLYGVTNPGNRMRDLIAKMMGDLKN